MKNGRARNFHLPLPEELYLELRRQAQRRGRPATVIAREALERTLWEYRRQELAEEIAEYARVCAGTGVDLDPELEAAATESLRKIDE
jgi:predicted DNA-binding protein